MYGNILFQVHWQDIIFQLHLRDKNERLYHKLEALQSKLNDLAVSKRDISSNYVLSEEEKLKVSMFKFSNFENFFSQSWKLSDGVKKLWSEALNFSITSIT